MGNAVVLAESARRTTTTGTAGETKDILADAQALVCVLDVTDADTDAGDTLDVKIQMYLGSGVESGEQWLDICAFTQILGNGADAITRVQKIALAQTEAAFETGSALAAGSVRHLLGAQLRAYWTIVDADSDGGFNFSVVVVPS